MTKRFFARVQLHDVKEGDDAYDDLHEGMEEQGFGRTIRIDDEDHRLPWGSYIGLAEKTGGTREKASERVAVAVKKTGYTASYVVVETEVGLRVSNLEPVEQPKSAEENLLDLLKRIEKTGV